MIVATCGADVLTAFTTALATVGNIGPGFGMIGPTENYAFYPDYVKWVLSAAMIIGRLEIYTILVLFTPMFWKKMSTYKIKSNRRCSGCRVSSIYL